MSHQQQFAELTSDLTELQYIMGRPMTDETYKTAIELITRISEEPYSRVLDLEPDTRAWANNLLRKWARIMQGIN